MGEEKKEKTIYSHIEQKPIIGYFPLGDINPTDSDKLHDGKNIDGQGNH